MSRIKEIDIEKAFGILLMIMGHQFYGDFFDKLIHGFHMPLFFIISGFLYKGKSDISACLKRKIQTLIIPYFFFSVFHLVALWIVKYGEYSDFVNYLKKYLYHVVFYNHIGMPICGAIWFLTALFFCELIYIVLGKLSMLPLKCLGIFLSVALGLWLSYSGTRLPYSMDVSLTGVGFFGIGHGMKFLFDKYNRSIKIWIPLICVFGASFVIMLNDSVNLRLATYGNPILFYFGASLMAFALFYIASNIKKFDGFVVKELLFIGQNSIIYLGFNQFVLIFLKRLNFNNLYINLGCKFFALLVCLCILHVISNLLTKTKLNVLVGK